MLYPHSFILNQSHSLSMSYDMVVKKELGLEEEQSVFATNLPVLPLHFLKVVPRLATFYPAPPNPQILSLQYNCG